jgi:hypothetical protein
VGTVTGHCFCNAIRFEVQGPEKFACFCHCNSCQRAAGAPLVPWATYEKSSFHVLIGEIDITLNTLDDPCGPVLRAHIYTEDKQPWLEITDGLPVYARNIG